MAGNRNDYDCVIIGTGLGGLVAGAYLAKEGIKVLLCEQHTQPGGYFTSFKKNGFTFDGGIQACEDMGMLLSVLRQIGVLDELDISQTAFALASPDGLYPLRSFRDVEAFYDNLIREYPHEENGIKKILGDMETYSGVMEAYCALPNPMFGPFKEVMKGYSAWKKKYKEQIKLKKEFFSTMKIPMDDYLTRHVNDPDLLRFFRALNYNGTPAGFMLTFHYVEMCYYYPKGGFQSISNALADFITRNGGQIRYRTLVDSILMDKRKARGIKLDTGEEIRARYVVSNSDARRTFLSLLPSDATKETFKRKLRETPVSESAIFVFLGVDIPADELPVKNCPHIFFVPDYRGIDMLDSLDDENCYSRAPFQLCIPSLHDPLMSPEGKTSMVIQAVAFMDYGDRWQTLEGKREDNYKAFKEKVADQLIANAEKIIPGLRDKIVYKSVATPFTCERYTLNSEGASAGWTYNPLTAINTGSEGFKGFMTPVKNLYLAGHWTMSPGGAPACFTSGKMVSSIIKWKKRFQFLVK